MSGKEKIKISHKKEEKLKTGIAEVFNEEYQLVSGKLLTTMEVVLPNGSQLEALKSRIKDVQARTWNSLMLAGCEERTYCFEVSDSISKEDIDSYKTKMKEFLSLLDRRVRNVLNNFQRVIANLVMLVVEDIKKQEALRKEIERIIIAESENRLMGWLKNVVEEEWKIR